MDCQFHDPLLLRYRLAAMAPEGFVRSWEDDECVDVSRAARENVNLRLIWADAMIEEMEREQKATRKADLQNQIERLERMLADPMAGRNGGVRDDWEFDLKSARHLLADLEKREASKPPIRTYEELGFIRCTVSNCGHVFKPGMTRIDPETGMETCPVCHEVLREGGPG